MDSGLDFEQPKVVVRGKCGVSKRVQVFIEVIGINELIDRLVQLLSNFKAVDFSKIAWYL